ncbi:MAG: YccF domain-containing protein [Acidobacteriota bacterium]
MSLIGNIIWLIFGGFFSGLAYILGGFLVCLTIIGIPFGVQSIKLGFATFAPFGKEIHETESSYGCLKIVFDVLWLFFIGWEIALLHLIFAAILAITIVGIPFAMQHIKLVPVSLFPFGQELR